MARSVLLSVALLLVAMVSIQTGASLAKTLFPFVGAQGTVALRIGFATLILLAVFRPWRHPLATSSWRPLGIYGAALGTMNLLYYLALRTLPLGITVALEFTGPLAVAVLSSRRPIDFLWIALALAGLMLLLPLGGMTDGIDPAGAAYALSAGACWALYIWFGQKAGANHGASTVALGSTVAALVVVPVGIAHAGPALFDPALILPGLAVAILSTALPYTLEMIALTRLPARTFGTLMSVEPAIAALAGFAFLDERLTPLQWAAIGAIIAASVGAAASVQSKRAEPAPG